MLLPGFPGHPDPFMTWATASAGLPPPGTYLLSRLGA